MPPKKKDDNKPKKAAVDKTFGMKNKKGGAAQKQIKQMEAQNASNKSAEQKRKDAEKEQKRKEKEAAEQAKKETAELFKPVQVQKVPFGVDPKTVLCQFFKKGSCEKGKKCKFSHDLNVERKTEKRNLYEDVRDGEKAPLDAEEDKKKDDMADWDEAKLRSVVMSKHGNPKTTTDKGTYALSLSPSPLPRNKRGKTDLDSVQILHRSSGKRQIRLVLAMSQRRRHMQIQALLTAGLRAQDEGAARSREGPCRQIPHEYPDTGRLARDRTTQAQRQPNTRHRRNIREMEEGEVRQETGGGRSQEGERCEREGAI